MTEYQVIEDIGGGLYVFIFGDDGEVVRGIENLEYLSHEDFIECVAALDDGGDASDWEGQLADAKNIYSEYCENSYGAEVVADQDGLKTERMGRAAQIAYGIEAE